MKLREKTFLIFFGMMFLSRFSFGTSVGDLVTIAHDTRFESRVTYYLLLAAINVMAEAANTPNHATRVQYARSVLLHSPNPYDIAVDVLTNTTIANEADLNTKPDFGILDNDIQFQINSLFNALAGVSN